jgi:hypothetical protein
MTLPLRTTLVTLGTCALLALPSAALARDGAPSTHRGVDDATGQTSAPRADDPATVDAPKAGVPVEDRTPAGDDATPGADDHGVDAPGSEADAPASDDAPTHKSAARGHHRKGHEKKKNANRRKHSA